MSVREGSALFIHVFKNIDFSIHITTVMLSCYTYTYFFLLWEMMWIERCNLNVIGAEALWLKESSFVVLSIICKTDMN